MMDEQIHDEPSEVEARDGNVIVAGPDHVDVVLTPDAAEVTGDRLLEESVRARGQTRLKDVPRPK